jgi:predicted kinase
MENDLTAYILVGAPGSGKSVYAAKLAEKENAVVISGDEIRQELYGDAAIQGDWGEIWERIEERVSECCGMSVILDGTHYRSSYRKEAIALLRSYGYEKIEAVVIDAPLDRCIMRNAARQRNVPRYVIVEMWEKLQASLKNISNEEFSHINFIY